MEKKKIILPIAGMIGALLLTLLLVFPMLSMEPKNIPIGIISLDEGMTTPKGKVNAGNMFISNIVKADNSLIKFEKVESEKVLNEDLEAGKYYAMIVVPKDFTKNSLAEKGKIDVTINEGLQPMVTMQLSQGLSAMSKKAGIIFDIKSINSISSLGMKALLLPMMLVMMTFIISLITSFLTTLNVKDENKVKCYLKQLVYIIVMSFVVGFTVSSVAVGISGVNLDIVKPALYLSFVSLALMVLVNGSVNLLGKKGIFIPMILFILGMGLIQMPYEYLNGIWQVLVASWEPFRYIGIGLREVLYQDHGIFNNATISLVIVILVGVVFSIIDLLKKDKN